MNINSSPTRRGRAAATSALAAAVLALSLTACGDDTSGITGAGSGRTTSSQSPTTETTPNTPSSEPTTTTDKDESDSGSEIEIEPEVEETEPETQPESEPSPRTDDSFNDGSHPYEYDEDVRTNFPGEEAVFDDSGSAGSDGETFWVTTPAEEFFAIDLPTQAEGWITGTNTIDLGDAGWGYLVTQSAGEYAETTLIVLDAGNLYIPERSDEVPFGDSYGEGGGPEFSTHTTDGARHLVTAFDDGTSYEWSVVDGTMVPTQIT